VTETRAQPVTVYAAEITDRRGNTATKTVRAESTLAALALFQTEYPAATISNIRQMQEKYGPGEYLLKAFP
jgi:hypothetical protein